MSILNKKTSSKGLSLLALLVWLIVSAVIGIFATKFVMKKLTFDEPVQTIIDVKSAMLNALSTEAGTVIIEAYPDSIIYQTGASSGGFRVSGDKPFKVFEKLKNGEWTVISRNICELKFKFFDEHHNELYEDEASENSNNIKEIMVSIAAHEGKENIDYYSETGVDLDGNMSNGAAKVEKAEFMVVIR